MNSGGGDPEHLENRRRNDGQRHADLVDPMSFVGMADPQHPVPVVHPALEPAMR
jgi:hypothetical protein